MPWVIASIALGFSLGCQVMNAGKQSATGIHASIRADESLASAAQPSGLEAPVCESEVARDPNRESGPQTKGEVRLVSDVAVVGDDESQQAPEAVPPAQTLDLATVFGLVDGQNPQVALARERILEAYARRDRADYL